MALPEVRMSFADRAALERELDQNLRQGRAFLTQASELPVLSECVLVLVHPDHGGELCLPAQVVMVNPSGPMCGMGLALRSCGPDDILRLQEFAADAGPRRGAAALGATHSADTRSEARAEAPASLDDMTAPAEAVSDSVAAVDQLVDTELPLSEEQELSLDDSELEADAESSPASDLQVGSRHDKLRHLNAAQQLKVARTGELSDRIAVERLYGKQVWDALLHNPRISAPEVARIARKGTVPKPLLDAILENGAWIKADAVRRALLSNPKIGAEAVLKLLRITPKHELKTIDKGSAYGMAVREAARKLLKQ
jgi:hypothetical protein